VSVESGFLEKWLPAIGYLVVLPPWIWMSVCTQDCLKFATTHRIPFSNRVIWLMKILALIIGAGGVFAAASGLGMPWYLAILPAGLVIFWALRENVQEVIPPKPVQDSAMYQVSWARYWALRTACWRSFVWFGAALLTTIFAMMLANKLPRIVGEVLPAVCFVAVLILATMISARRLQFFRWPCPRCGCAFNGLWNRPWFPKRCVYCGLPRENRGKTRLQDSPVSGH
jgi:hypothetical protein